MTDQTFPQQQYTSIETAELNRLRARLLETPAVVVPEPTSDEWRAIAENARSADMVDFLSGAAAYGLWLRGKIPNSIPAHRVLGDGMVQVRLEWLRDVLALLMDFDNAPAPVSTSKRLYALLSAPEALVPNNRANQGGAAT